jgi:2'-5' RNA ligase
MRIFIGLSLNQEQKSYLKKVQDVVKLTTLKGTFTHFNNFHITLKYIGHVTSSDIDNLMDIMDKVSSNMDSFSLKIGDFGAFTRKNSSIIWIGITKGSSSLSRLYQKIEAKCVESGFEPDNRKYKPHITLGKKVVFANDHNIVDIPFYSKEVKIEKITLFESSRIDGILTYTPIYQVNLN